MTIIAIPLIFTGLALVVWGIQTLKGPVNVWLIDAHKWGYTSIPHGSMILLLGIALLPFIPGDWRLSVVLMGIITQVIGLFVPHKYLDPPWMKWLKQEQGNTMPLLQR